MVLSVVTSSQASGNAGSNNRNMAMEDLSNSLHAMHQQLQDLQQQQQLHSVETDQQQRFDDSLVGNVGANTSHNLFQSQQQQNRHPDYSSQSYNNEGVHNANPINISNEIKRLQQLHQLGAGGVGSSNALLMNPGSSSHDPTTSAFLQSMFAPDAQQQKANIVGSNRFENQLTGGALLSSNINNNVAAQSLSNLPADNPMNPIPMQLPSNFLNDARFLMAQNQVFQQSQGLPFAMIIMPQQQQQQQEQALCGTIGASHEMPLPSPHSLFHRDGSRRMRGGVIEPFPEKLHRLLMEVEAAGRSDVISFVASGRAFVIHKPDKFFKEIVPLYFRQSRLSSFKRQLNLYGFELINTGPARGGYYHEHFQKDRPELCRRMRRVAVKVGSDVKRGKPTDPTDEKPCSLDGPIQQEEVQHEDDQTNEQDQKQEGDVAYC